MLGESGFILLRKRLAAPVAALPMATAMTAFGLALSLPVAPAEAASRAPVAEAALWAVGFWALIPTVGGFLRRYAGAARVTVAEASVFTAVAPVSAALLAALVLGEPIGLRQAAGVACVLVAIAVLTWGGALRPLAAR